MAERPSREKGESRHRLVLENWNTIRSEAKTLIHYHAFAPEIIPELEKTIEELDDFFATFREYLYITGVCSRIATVGWVLWPRLIDLTSRDNFAKLLEPLILRFEHYYTVSMHAPVNRRPDFEQLQAFWGQLKASYALLTKPEHDLRLFLSPLSYAVGVMSGLAGPRSGGIGTVPGFEHFQADIVSFTNTLTVIDKFEMLHNFVQQIAGDLAMDLHFFVRYLRKIVPGDARKAKESTAALRTVKLAFDAESAKLTKP